ncbi:D-aminoacyl-tRNA deacylase [Acholeplasma hippikon]|nr:D-aminoacyl-tRNA deacylase [Acholeplasma hippikon]
MLVARVNHAKLEVEGKEIANIGSGYIVYFGVKDTDTLALAEKCANKLNTMRLIHDEDGKMNLKLDPKTQEILVVSQFTLYGDASNNNRPSFTKAAKGDQALPIYLHFVECLRKLGHRVQTGQFGAHMIIQAEYDGPLNLLYELE